MEVAWISGLPTRKSFGLGLCCSRCEKCKDGLLLHECVSPGAGRVQQGACRQTLCCTHTTASSRESCWSCPSWKPGPLSLMALGHTLCCPSQPAGQGGACKNQAQGVAFGKVCLPRHGCCSEMLVNQTLFLWGH